MKGVHRVSENTGFPLSRSTRRETEELQGRWQLPHGAQSYWVNPGGRLLDTCD